MLNPVELGAVDFAPASQMQEPRAVLADLECYLFFSKTPDITCPPNLTLGFCWDFIETANKTTPLDHGDHDPSMPTTAKRPPQRTDEVAMVSYVEERNQHKTGAWRNHKTNISNICQTYSKILPASPSGRSRGFWFSSQLKPQQRLWQMTGLYFYLLLLDWDKGCGATKVGSSGIPLGIEV